MRKRKRTLKTIGVVVPMATLVVAVVALVIAVRNARRLDDLTADHMRLCRVVMKRGSDTGGGDAGVPIGLPADWARGGDLVIRLRQRPVAINPLLIRDAPAQTVCSLVCETLARRDLDTMEFGPGLATDWEISADRLTYTFHLNPLARFSDREPVTAEDVAFTFRMLRNERLRGQAGAAFLEDLTEVRAVDPLTVRFTFSRPYFLAFAAIADRYIVPRHVYGTANPAEGQPKDLLVGSGPFVVEEKTFSLTGDAIVLKRNEDYWDRAHVPALDAVEFRIVPGDERAFQLLKTNGVHMMYLSPEQYREMEADENFLKYHRLFRYYAPHLGYVYIGWNNRRGPFSDARVRRAMTRLAPRRKMVSEIYMGLARVVEVPFWSDGPQYPPEVVPEPFDPAAAEALLDEAGWTLDVASGLRRKAGQPFRATLLALQAENRHNTLVGFLTREAKRVGLDIAVEWVTLAEMQARMEARDFDALLLGWTTAREIDPYLLWHSSQTRAGGLNLVGFADPEADRLTETIRHELDSQKRNDLCHDLARLLAREQPYTMLLEPEALVAVSAKFQGLRRYRLGLRPEEWYIPRGIH